MGIDISITSGAGAQEGRWTDSFYQKVVADTTSPPHTPFTGAVDKSSEFRKNRLILVCQPFGESGDKT
jgi:hypothetical protein